MGRVHTWGSGFNPQDRVDCVWVHVCDLHTQDVEAEGWEIQSYCQYQPGLQWDLVSKVKEKQLHANDCEIIQMNSTMSALEHIAPAFSRGSAELRGVSNRHRSSGEASEEALWVSNFSAQLSTTGPPLPIISTEPQSWLWLICSWVFCSVSEDLNGNSRWYLDHNGPRTVFYTL